MSPQEQTSTVHTLVELWNRRELAEATRLLAPDVELTSVAGGDLFRGRDGWLQHAQAWAAALPDARLEILHLAASKGAVTVECLLRGTHTGALVTPHGHIPPTWCQVELRVCDVLEFEAGLVARVRSYLDSATLLRQLGLLPGSPLHAPDRRAPLDLYALEHGGPPEQRNKAAVQRLVDQVLNRHDAHAAAELCVPNVALHGGPLGEIRDLGAYQQLLAKLFVTFPDLHVEILDLVAEGDRVVARLLTRGTHLGDFQGIPATGRRIHGQGTTTFRVADGRVLEEWWDHDLLGVMRQMDAVPARVRHSPPAPGAA